MVDQIGYDQIIEESMRVVIHKVLGKVKKEGLKGDHHFLISFSTKHFGTIISPALKVKFPSEMTIIIQHQYSSFEVLENCFKIALSFSGVMENMTIPYKAITSFADPSVNFGLKFNNADDDINEENLEPDNLASGEETDLSKKIVSLDDFRNNRNK